MVSGELGREPSGAGVRGAAAGARLSRPLARCREGLWQRSVSRSWPGSGCVTAPAFGKPGRARHWPRASGPADPGRCLQCRPEPARPIAARGQGRRRLWSASRVCRPLPPLGLWRGFGCRCPRVGGIPWRGDATA